MSDETDLSTAAVPAELSAAIDNVNQQGAQEEQSTPPEVTPDGEGGYNHGVASVFANRKDLARYREAKARGASEIEALRVGDNGRGKWGDDTTAPTPQVALPNDTAGLAHGRMVEIQGPKGTTIARVTDAMPSTPHLRGRANVDLNPAAAAAVGSTGLDHVRWRFVDGAQGNLANAPVPEGLAGQFVRSQAADPSTLTAGGEVALSQGDDSSGEVGPSDPTDIDNQVQDLQDAVQGGGAAQATPPLPPTSQGATFQHMNPDGSKHMSNGVDVYPNNSIKYSEGSKTFYQSSPYAKPVDISAHWRSGRPVWDEKSGTIQNTRMDPATGKIEMTGISPTDPSFKATQGVRQQMALLGHNTQGMSNNDVMEVYNKEVDGGYIPKQIMAEAIKSANFITKNSQLQNFPKIKQAYGEVMTGMEKPGSVSDIALVDGISRMMNPQRGVSQGAVINTQNAANGILSTYFSPEYIKEKMWDGAKFTPDARKRISELATNLYNEQKLNLGAPFKNLTFMARSAGVKNPDNLVSHLIDSAPMLNSMGQQIAGQDTTPLGQVNPAPAPVSPQATVKVRRMSDGRTGTMPAANVNTSKYQIIP